MHDLDAGQLEAIRHFADRLVPEAFEHPYSAYDIRLADPPASFASWVDHRIHDALTFEYPWGGRPTSLIVVEDDRLRATWHGCSCEDCGLSETCLDVQREVVHMREPWTFAMDLPGPREEWREIFDEATQTYDEVLVVPEPEWRANWYAEARGRGTATVLTGSVVLHVWDRIGMADLPPGTAFDRHARRVLFRHPARRSHRLRGSHTSER